MTFVSMLGRFVVLYVLLSYFARPRTQPQLPLVERLSGAGLGCLMPWLVVLGLTALCLSVRVAAWRRSRRRKKDV